jgi:hypothetical protein
MVTWSLQQQFDLEANCQVIKRQTKNNLENGKEYVGFLIKGELQKKFNFPKLKLLFFVM